jgi:L-threonylcarbamoyladenylate synthase
LPTHHCERRTVDWDVKRTKAAVEILPTHTPALFEEAVTRAVNCLRAGEAIVLPTETVYGLAANAFDAAAVAKIFEIKGRPAQNPIIIHVSSIAMAKRCVSEWPSLAEQLASAFWPGPLTLVLPRSAAVPDIVTAGGSTVGVRWPSHPFIQAVINECGFPLAAPSANPASRLSPTTAEHVRATLGSKLKLIVDGGPSQIGIESTVLDLTQSPPQILRPGMIHAESLVAVTGELASGPERGHGALRSPGQFPKHYAPKAKLAIWKWSDATDLLSRIHNARYPGETVHVIAHTRIPLDSALRNVSVIPHDPPAYARAIYAELHRCDEAGAELIVVEAPPESAEWAAITDRLNRACA